MSEAKHCPHCGAPLASDDELTRIEAPGVANEPEWKPEAEANLEQEVPATSLLAPGSSDETFLSGEYDQKDLDAEPDPILGKFTATGSGVTSAVTVGTEVSMPVTKRQSGSSSNFPAFNLDLSPKPPTSTTPKAPTPDINDEDEEEEEDAEPRSRLPRVLLASYASAITLALVWLVMRDRARDKAEIPEPPSRIEKTQPPITADLSKMVHPPEPILGEHMAKLGQPLKVGSLEITPLDVKRQDVKLQRLSVLSVPEVRDGGKKALVLRLKLKNITNDKLFAPLDPVYLRARGDQIVDTFVTTANDERVYPYRLALESDMSIVGQDFTELRPGESRTVAIVTAPDAPSNDAGPFTWRVRLRTGIDRTDVIGLVWPAPTEVKTKNN